VHPSVLTWVRRSLAPDEVEGSHVLEVGSYDVNGSVRPVIEALAPASYTGVDRTAGPGVDLVCDVADLAYQLGYGSYDIVISTEMLEHVDDWQAAVRGVVSVARPDGLVLITTRSKGFPYHPFPVDNWRFSVDQMEAIMAAAGCDPLELRSDPQVPGVFVKARRVGPIGELAGLDVGKAP